MVRRIRLSTILSAKPDLRLDVDRVIDAIKAAFPGMRITADDYFRAEKEKVLELVRSLEKRLPPPDVYLKDIERRRHRFGPGKSIAIPINEHTVLAGYVWSTNITLEPRDV